LQHRQYPAPHKRSPHPDRTRGLGLDRTSSSASVRTSQPCASWSRCAALRSSSLIWSRSTYSTPLSTPPPVTTPAPITPRGIRIHTYVGPTHLGAMWWG
jgi:hypothetical protein